MKSESAQAVEVTSVDPSSDDVWLVQTRSGVRSWSLDELDAAFQRGEVDAATLVHTTGMAAWTTLGVIASLDEPIGNDTGTPPEPSSPRAVAPPPASSPRAVAPTQLGPRALLPPPPVSPPAPAAPPAPGDPGSFAPTSANVFGDGGAAMWASITTAHAEGETGLRHHTPIVPFTVRRAFGGALDVLSSVRHTYPRWAAAGPWLFGAALSGIFVFSLYRLANAPAISSAPAQSNASAASTAPSSRDGARLPAVPEADALPVPASRALTARASDGASAGAPPGNDPSRDAAASERLGGDDAASDDSSVLRPRDLRLAPSRSERQLTRSHRAKAKATSAAARKAKARAARKRRAAPRD